MNELKNTGISFVDEELAKLGEGVVKAPMTIADTYTVLAKDNVVLANLAAAKVATLPAVADVPTGKTFTFVQLVGTHFLTVKGAAAGETINGVSGTTGFVFDAQWETITVMNTGAVWVITSGYLVG